VGVGVGNLPFGTSRRIENEDRARRLREDVVVAGGVSFQCRNAGTDGGEGARLGMDYILHALARGRGEHGQDKGQQLPRRHTLPFAYEHGTTPTPPRPRLFAAKE
jgi:hypothetical protein